MPPRVISDMEWNEAELIEFFGVLPSFCDDSQSHAFTLSRDGLRLDVTLFSLFHSVDVGIYRDGITDPVIWLSRENCTHAFVVDRPPARRCLQIGSPEYPVTSMGIAPLLVRGLRVFVEPHFRIEFIDAEVRNDAA